ncbi:MAG: biopolymer transporter ExbD [Deltaproteobacteria bacterium]|nr:biopolymer transporter ExbD [Deltaproteobacteria bacterium]
MAHRPTSRRKRNVDADAGDLNLTPVMNLFMVIIPFLLMTAVFVNTTIIEIHLPQESKAPQAPSDKKVTEDDILTIGLTAKGFTFSGLGKRIATIKKKDGKFDFISLQKKLVELKKKHPTKEEVVLLFKADAPYDLVIDTMDATRIALVKNGETTTKQNLFPMVSVGEISE